MAESTGRGRGVGSAYGGARSRAEPALKRAAEAAWGARGANDVDGWAEARARLAATERRLDELEAEAGTSGEAPADHARVAREAELEAVLAAPIEGSVAAGYQRKEAALRAELGRLTVAESRVLAARLRRAHPDDRIAALFGRMTAERQGRLLGFLDDARRREAVSAERRGPLR